jgi:hypothetical protein
LSNYVVLGGGASVRRLSLRNINRVGTLIAVNDAALYTRADIALSVSPEWIENRLPLLSTVAPGRIVLADYCARIVPDDWRGPPVSFMKGCEAMNSGIAALILAADLVTDYKRKFPGMAMPTIYLVGIDCGPDADGREYWYPDYPWPRRRRARDLERYAPYEAELFKLTTSMYHGGLSIIRVGDFLPGCEMSLLQFQTVMDLPA